MYCRVPGNKLHPEYSAYMTTIFGKQDLAGKDVLQALFAESSAEGGRKDQIEVALGAIVGEDSMMFGLQCSPVGLRNAAQGC